MGNADQSGREARNGIAFGDESRSCESASSSTDDGRLGNASQRGLGIDGSSPRNAGYADKPDAVNGFWSDAIWLPCTDGKARAVEPGTFPLAHGAPARVGRLRAYGNAIVAPAAAAVVRAYMERS